MARCALPLLVSCLAALGCGRATQVTAIRASAAPPLRWLGARSVRRVVDLSAPRADGSIVVATAGHLALLTGKGLTSFAPGYLAPSGLEPYIALSTGERVAAAHCRFPTDSVYALRLTAGRGVTEVSAAGRVGRFVRPRGPGLENGIAFDTTGRFGHRLLVTSTAGENTTVYAIDCRGHVKRLATAAPRLEGGIAVAPVTFGEFAGDLIAPAEVPGKLYAIAPSGRVTLLADSGVPHGQDIGVESEGFVPARFGEALVADRRTPGNRHPGDDFLLTIPRPALAGAGVRAGDLLVVTEGGANTIDVRCRKICRVREIATGPPEAHIEGHVVFTVPPQ